MHYHLACFGSAAYCPWSYLVAFACIILLLCISVEVRIALKLEDTLGSGKAADAGRGKQPWCI